MPAMSQLPLVRPERPARRTRPTPAKSLNRHLRAVRDAEIMPWSEGEAASWEKLFPQRAASLPDEKAEGSTAEFATEPARLRAAS